MFFQSFAYIVVVSTLFHILTFIYPVPKICRRRRFIIVAKKYSEIFILSRLVIGNQRKFFADILLTWVGCHFNQTSEMLRIILGVLQIKNRMTMTMNIWAIFWSLFCLFVVLGSSNIGIIGCRWICAMTIFNWNNATVAKVSSGIDSTILTNHRNHWNLIPTLNLMSLLNRP